MRRIRFQKGNLRQRQHGRARVWLAQWYEGGTRRAKVLGPCAQMTRSQAEFVLAAILRPINEGRAHTLGPVYTFDQFVERAYFPHCRRTWKESTESTSVPVIRNHLVAAFRDRLLGTVTRIEMQDLLEAKALLLGASMVRHLRWHLNGIFKLAMADGLIGHNPAAELRIPKRCKPGRQLRPLTEDEVHDYLGSLELQERLLARLTLIDGLRGPGENLALRWGALLEEDIVLVRERVYQGKFDTPKSGKRGDAKGGDAKTVKKKRKPGKF